MAILTLLHPLLTTFQSHPLPSLILTLLTPLLFYTWYNLYLHPLSRIPGPLLARLTPLWLYHSTYTGVEATKIHNLHQLYGRIVRIAPNQLSISSPDAINPIYVSGGGYPKSPCYANFDIDGHRTIFSATEPGYRNVRAKAVAPLFSTASIRANSTKLMGCVDAFVARLERARDRSRRIGGNNDDDGGKEGDEATTMKKKKKKKKKKKAVNILTLTRGLAIDVVSTHLFSRTYGANSEKVGQELSVGAFVDAFVGVGRFFYLPTSVFVRVEYLSDLVFGEEKTALSMKLVDCFVESVVAGCEASSSSSSTDGKTGQRAQTREENFPGRLLALGLTREEVKAQCKDLVFAGTDSTGMNLATALRELVLHPEILTKLERELEDNKVRLEDDRLEGQSLPYLTGVVKETLRLSMANPTRLPHRVPRGQTLVVDGVVIPEGCDVGIAAYTLHLDPESFPDPAAFRPERWVGMEEDEEEEEEEGGGEKSEMSSERRRLRDRMGKAWFAFGAGSRMCIARNLATVELYMAVQKVVESGVLRGARVAEEKVELLEWFNSRVVGEEIGLIWD